MPTDFYAKTSMKTAHGPFRGGTMREIFTHRAWNSRAIRDFLLKNSPRTPRGGGFPPETENPEPVRQSTVKSILASRKFNAFSTTAASHLLSKAPGKNIGGRGNHRVHRLKCLAHGVISLKFLLGRNNMSPCNGQTCTKGKSF